jgi:hypothetical protein
MLWLCRNGFPLKIRMIYEKYYSSIGYNYYWVGSWSSAGNTIRCKNSISMAIQTQDIMDDHVQGFFRQDWPADEARGKLSLPTILLTCSTSERNLVCTTFLVRLIVEAFHWQDALLKVGEQHQVIGNARASGSWVQARISNNGKISAWMRKDLAMWDEVQGLSLRLLQWLSCTTDAQQQIRIAETQITFSVLRQLFGVR